MEDIAANWHIYIGALILGTGVGMLTSLFGAGGGFIITPILNIVLGLPFGAATSTSALHILGTSSMAIYQKRKQKLGSIFSVAICLIIGDLPGVWAGQQVLNWAKNMGKIQVWGKQVTAVEMVGLSVLGVLLVGVIGWLVWDNFFSKHEVDPDDREGVLAKLKIPPMRKFASLDGEFSATVLVLIGFVVGALAGLLGIGGGVIILPVLVYLVGQKTVMAARTDLFLVWTSAVMKVIFGLGDVKWLVAGLMLAGAALGTNVGSYVQDRISGKGLRRWFCLVVGAALLLVVYQFGVMFDYIPK